MDTFYKNISARSLPQSEPLSTKTTRIGNNLYGCRIYNLGKLIVEMRVPRQLISTAYRDMFRTLDKLGYKSKMAHSSRMRGKNHGILNGYKYIWYN